MSFQRRWALLLRFSLSCIDRLFLPFYEIFVDDSIGRREESKDVFDEFLFLRVHLVPISHVFPEINFLSGPALPMTGGRRY